MNLDDLKLDRLALAAICRAHGVRSLRIFGSFARGDATADSDVDVLVEFLPDVDARVGLLELAGLQIDLESLLGRPVDVKEPGNFRPESRPRVLREAVVAYAA
jgi:uncharacterized protein